MKWLLRSKAFSLSRAHPFLRWSAYLFLAIGALILGYLGFVLLDVWVFQTYHAWRFQRALKDSGTAAAEITAPNRTSRVLPNPPGSNRVRGNNPVRSITADGSLGRIEVRRIGLTAMIVEGTDTKALRRAVGHVTGTALPGEQGNIAIAGHRDTFFRALRNIRTNDEITLTTLNGTYTYQVDYTRVVGPDDTEVISASAYPVLTLVTCYPFYYVGPAPERFVVRAHKSL